HRPSQSLSRFGDGRASLRGKPDLAIGRGHLTRHRHSTSCRLPIDTLGCRLRSFFGALPEFFRGWAESAFWSDDADRDWFRLRSNVQKFQAVPKTVTKVRGNGDAGSRFDGRHNGGKTVVLLH